MTPVDQMLDADDLSVSLHARLDSSTEEDDGKCTLSRMTGLGLEHDYVEIQRRASDDEMLDVVDDAHEFCLFSAAREKQSTETRSINPSNSGTKATLPGFATLIRLDSLSQGTSWMTNVIGSDLISYSRPQKPLSSYLIDDASSDHLTACQRLQEMMIPGEDVIARSKLPCPGMHYRWRVLHLPSASGFRARSWSKMKFEDLGKRSNCKQAKKGKKERIKLRKRLRRTGATSKSAGDAMLRTVLQPTREDTSILARDNKIKQNLDIDKHDYFGNNEEKQRKAIKDKERQKERNRKKQRKKREKARQREPK